MEKKTLVLGASDNPSRYSYLAIQKLRQYGHSVVAVGRKNTKVDDVTIVKEHKDIDHVDTITVYMNPAHQQEYYNYVLSLNPKRIIFNPGAENPELSRMAKEKGIESINACTLVMLSTNQY